MLKADIWIRQRSLTGIVGEELIKPFCPHTYSDKEGNRLISYGVSSYGYDIRVADEFYVFTNLKTKIIDPKDFSKSVFSTFTGNICIIPPNSFALAKSVEHIKMPRNVTGIVLGKSTYARCGVNVNCTPLEAGWEGFITIEISNTTPLPVKIYANEGIAQILFFESDVDCQTSYADRHGKYQKQKGIKGLK